MATAPPKRRPGYPRKVAIPNRITIRMKQALADRMNAVCDERGWSQRAAIEAAVKAELARAPKERPKLQRDEPDDPPLYRTGMWIDPDLLERMDFRIADEQSSQRALIEDAVERWVGKYERG